MRGQAFPNEHHGGDTIPALKFARRIEKDTIRIDRVLSPLRWQARRAMTDSSRARISRGRSTWRGAINKRNREIAGRNRKKNPAQDFFFTAMRAAAKEHECDSI